MTDNELDAFCAEFVMGLKESHSIFKVDEWSFYNHEVYGPMRKGKAGHHILERFNPTTDRAAAMEVMEACCQKLRKDCLHFRIFCSSESWFCVGADNTRWVITSEDAPTMKRAICNLAHLLFGK